MFGTLYTIDTGTDSVLEAAERIGANAVLAVRFTTVHITPGAAEILVYGTAVRLEDL